MRYRVEMSEPQLPDPHDRFFKSTFSRVEVVHDMLPRLLDDNVIDCLDLETLRPLKDSFVGDDLRQAFSDLVYEVT